MNAYLLDTNVISDILKKHDCPSNIASKLQSVLKENAKILICPIVFYEVRRGLYHQNQIDKINEFESLISNFNWCEFNRNTWDTGAKIWAKCRLKGKPTGGGIEHDVLIAAQAQEHEAIVVTNNIEHFQNLGVRYESWAIL